MIQLAEEVFATKNDPDQLDVNEEIIAQLQKLHPATVSERATEEGPIAWLLLIPTTTELMNRFLEKKISEKDLFERTSGGIKYEALYLCSAMVLSEYRRKGITKELALSAISKIRKDHPLKCLFVWSFSPEGDLGAEAIAALTALPLHKRQ